jgi:hypothetical protein
VESTSSSIGQDWLGGLLHRAGGGRKPTVEKDVTLLADLEALVGPTSRGDPESPLRGIFEAGPN